MSLFRFELRKLLLNQRTLVIVAAMAVLYAAVGFGPLTSLSEAASRIGSTRISPGLLQAHSIKLLLTKRCKTTNNSKNALAITRR
jgi:hypothetical protein